MSINEPSKNTFQLGFDQEMADKLITIAKSWTSALSW
jgi:hypothetical protein